MAAVYWLDIGVTFLVYGAVALFAERAIVLEGRDIYLPGVNRQTERAEKWNHEPNGVHIIQALPPIYLRNVRLVCMSVVWGLGMLGVAAVALPDLVEYVLSVPLVLTALSMAVSRLYLVSREFFGERHYEKYSVHEVLEIPGRLLGFAACYLAFVVVVGGVALLLGGELLYTVGITPDIDVGLAFGVAIVAGKVSVEWFRFQGQNQPEPTGLAAWFHPQERIRENRELNPEHKSQHENQEPTGGGIGGWRSNISLAMIFVASVIVYLLSGAIQGGETIIAVVLGISLVRLLWEVRD